MTLQNRRSAVSSFSDATADVQLLIVTRENNFDKRYGLAKSLTPVLTELGHHGVEIRYLCQAEVTPRNERLLRKLHAKINLILSYPISRATRTNFYTLSWAILERLNMGRLAALVQGSDNSTHVHCHDPIIAAGYQFFRPFRRARHGVTQHGYGSYTQALHEDGVELGPWIMKRMRSWENRILKRADWVIAPSASGLRQLARDLGCYPMPEHWVSIVHPKPSFSSFSRDTARQALGWTDKTIEIISVGRQVPLKDFSTLIAALGRTRTQRPWRLTILGDGDWSALQESARAAGIPAERIQIACSDDIGCWLAAADLYVSTSLTESFGMANHEAVCAGLPCILTAVAAVPETAKNAATYIPAKDPETLAIELDRLIDHDIERTKLAQRARDLASRWPSTSQIAKAYLDCYRGQPIADVGLRERLGAATTAPIAFDQLTPMTQRLPLFEKPRPLRIPERSRVLVFAPHMDDETFSMGGTILALKRQQCCITVVAMTHDEDRLEEFLAAGRVLGIDDHEILDEVDGDVRNHEALREQIVAIIQRIAPSVIFAPAASDIHRDHLNASLAVVQAWSESGFNGRLCFYEFWQPLAATHYTDISGYRDQKDEAVACYKLPSRHLDYRSICRRLQAFRISIMADSSSDAEAFLEVTAADAYDLILTQLQSRWLSREVSGA